MAQVIDGAHVVVSHLGDGGDAHRTALQRRVPSVRMVHSIGQGYGRELAGSTLLVFNAEATRANLAEWSGESMILNPPVDPERYRTTPGDLVTLVNATDEKGMVTVADVAARMPATGFLAVTSARGSPIPFHSPNGELIPTTEDMRAVYGRTRILLMPSMRETWGRTAVEAAISGIPTIAAPTDGLRECLGDAGLFVDRDNVAGWCAAIERLSDPDEWAVWSARALERAAVLETRRVAQLDALADRLLSMCLTHRRASCTMGV